MEAQKPAEGITLNQDFGDSKFYTVECSCGSPDDAIEFYVEVDDDMMDVMVNTTCTQKTDYWTRRFNEPARCNEFVSACYRFANALWIRLCLTNTIWFKGYVEYKSYTIMSKQQALNYAETLKMAIKDVETFDSAQKIKRAQAAIKK